MRSPSSAIRVRPTTPSITVSPSRNVARSFSGIRTTRRTTSPGTYAQRVLGLRSDASRHRRTPASSQDLFDTFASALTDNTKVLSLTHVSNVSGIRLPVKDLAEAAHARGIHVHLDGAQSWGALDVDLRDLGVDSYSASAHKWFMGPKEAGVLYVKESNIPRIWPNIVAPGWGDDVDPDPRGARKFESLGQRDDACLAAVGTTVDFHNAIGAERIEARMIELATALKGGLEEAGLSLVTPRAAELSGGVCIGELEGRERAEVVIPAVRGARYRRCAHGRAPAVSSCLQHGGAHRTCRRRSQGDPGVAGSLTLPRSSLRPRWRRAWRLGSKRPVRRPWPRGVRIGVRTCDWRARARPRNGFPPASRDSRTAKRRSPSSSSRWGEPS